MQNPAPSLQKSDKKFVIHGKVVEAETGEPLPGASIVIKGTTVGTVSGKDGKFELTDPNPGVDASTGSLISELVVSFVGKETSINTFSASGEAIKNNTFTVKLKDAVILLT